MRNMLEYKGYFGSVEYSDEDGVFYGKICFIRSLISYEGDSVASLKADFQEAVDDYLDLCKEQNREPEKSFKGTFNVRVGQDLHRQASVFAESHHLNLNQVVVAALKEYLSEHLTR